MPSGTQAGIERLLARRQKRSERYQARLAERAADPVQPMNDDRDEVIARWVLQLWCDGDKRPASCICLPIRRI